VLTLLRSVATLEVASGLAVLSDEELEAIAAQAWEGLSEVGDVEDLARRRGVEVEPERDLPEGFDGLALPHKLLVRPSRTRGLWVLRVLHELAHHWLAERFHTHADVWRLTLALAWPLQRVRRGSPCLEIPPWAQELRTLVLAESRLIPAA
jgi:hypothetical protein